MLFKVGADFLVLVHLAFICFVLLGGFLLLRWRWLGDQQGYTGGFSNTIFYRPHKLPLCGLL